MKSTRKFFNFMNWMFLLGFYIFFLRGNYAISSSFWAGGMTCAAVIAILEKRDTQFQILIIAGSFLFAMVQIFMDIPSLTPFSAILGNVATFAFALVILTYFREFLFRFNKMICSMFR